MKLSSAQIRYLLAMREIATDGKLRSNEIAEKMNVSRPSVHRMLLQLEKMALITKERYSFVMLTEQGAQLAEIYADRLRRLSRYFVGSMGVCERTARESAITLLGELDEETVREINNKILLYTT
ncbi:MAG: MarR family transcriptional regulator [Oscillospiraceae bacterium]|nr:MarR family transcriptional regulator [Oscillospiraceae bacterium]